MTFRVPAHIQFRTVDQDVVLLDTRTDQFLGLNATAAMVWHPLAAGKSPEDAASSLTETTDVPLEVALRDAITFGDDLERRGLLERAEL
jgi:hypothetical protein